MSRNFIKISAVGATTNPILEKQRKYIYSKHEKKVQVTKQIQNEDRTDRLREKLIETDDKIIKFVL